jgi:predicted transglutaminase-like cysteine proteinase
MVQVDRESSYATAARCRAVPSAGALAGLLGILIVAMPASADPLAAPAPIGQPLHLQSAQSRNTGGSVSGGTSVPAQASNQALDKALGNTPVAELDIAAFGKVVAERDDFRLVPAWQRVLQRAAADDALCRGSCGSKAWRQVIADLRRLPHEAQIAAVQQRLNRVPYRDDLDNWHSVDYWATPDEFLRKGGDCEDYAIAKYFALRAAGWSAADLRVMLSHRRGESIGHAYLILRDQSGWLVLDNRQLRPYRPVAAIDELWAGYSFNERGLWIHRNIVAPNFVVSSTQ